MRATPPIPGHDGEPPEFLRLRDLAEGKGKRTLVSTENVNTDRIGWLQAHHRITLTQLQAGRRLQADWELAKIGGYSLSGAPGGSSGTFRLPDAKIDAQSRHGAAVRVLGGLGGAIVEAVVLDGVSLGKAEARFRLPVGGALGALRVALDVLARHYGMG